MQVTKRTSRISQEFMQLKTPLKHLFRQNKTKYQKVEVPKLIHLFDLKELDVEDQLRVTRDAGKSLLAVGEMGRDRDATLSTDSHASNTDVPALDDFALTELEAERLALLVGCTEMSVSNNKYG